MINLAKATAVRSLAKSKLRLGLNLVLGFILLGAVFLFIQTTSVSRDSSLVPFEIEKGESVTAIATKLHSAKLLRSPLYFRLLVRQLDLTIQAGVYQLSPSLSPRELALTLTKGLAIDKKLTIPEGFRAEQIAELAGIDSAEFLAASRGLEGRLFPDTYYVKTDLSASELVALLNSNFETKVGQIDDSTLILASLVERETKGDDEKPVVAGILKKRLNALWPLELDATVQYALGQPDNWWPNTTLADRQIKSPYNTYLNLGLPPSPIGNPGLASITAVQNSVESPYWFYLHDRSGTIRYAETNAEHNQNIAKYIR